MKFALGLLLGASAGMLLGSYLGIRGYRRRQWLRLIESVRVSAYTPRSATIPYAVDAEDHMRVLSPLTGRCVVPRDLPPA